MMNSKYSICCGLDVHKNVIVATIVTTGNEGISEYIQKSFSTIHSDIQKFHDWLTHPKYVKTIKGKKADKKASKWIADLYKFDLVRCSFIPQKTSGNSANSQNTVLSWPA